MSAASKVPPVAEHLPAFIDSHDDRSIIRRCHRWPDFALKIQIADGYVLRKDIALN